MHIECVDRDNKKHMQSNFLLVYSLYIFIKLESLTKSITWSIQ